MTSRAINSITVPLRHPKTVTVSRFTMSGLELITSRAIYSIIVSLWRIQLWLFHILQCLFRTSHQVPFTRLSTNCDVHKCSGFIFQNALWKLITFRAIYLMIVLLWRPQTWRFIFQNTRFEFITSRAIYSIIDQLWRLQMLQLHIFKMPVWNSSHPVRSRRFPDAMMEYHQDVHPSFQLRQGGVTEGDLRSALPSSNGDGKGYPCNPDKG